MKTIVTCASIAAVGAVGLQAQELRDPAPSKPWSVGLKVRGFYDDNYTTAPNNQNPAAYAPGMAVREKLSSWGFNVNPNIAVDWLQDMTTIRLKYEYDARWYADRPGNKWDQTHQVRLGVDHRFSECYSLEVYDSLVIGQEPGILAPNAAPGYATFQRTDGSNLRNYGGAALNMQYTEQLGARVAYANTLYDYEDSGYIGSMSSLLDRMNQQATADLRWRFTPTTVGLLGYQFENVDQNSSDPIGRYIDPGTGTVTFAPANLRNRRSHFMFVGGTHDLAVKHLVNWRAGAQYADYPDAIASMEGSKWLPYVDVMYQYLLAEQSRFQFGARHQMYQTDVTFAAPNFIQQAPTQDAATTTIYSSVSYDITPRLVGMARGSLQFSKFNGGFYDSKLDSFYTADINLRYEINRYLDAEVGYAWDRLDSDISLRRYTRNRVYFGFIGRY